MKTRLASLLSASLVACALVSSAVAQNLILNGSFEANTVDANPTYVEVGYNNTSLVTNWTLAASSNYTAFIVADTNVAGGGFPDAAAGSNYLAINTDDTQAGVGYLYQDFATTLGATYNVSFSAGSTNRDGINSIGIRGDVFNVISGSTSGGVIGSASSVSSDGSATFYPPTDFSFVATGDTSRLVFTDISTFSGSVDVFLDNVSVSMTASAIPEPSTYAAIFGAATLGLAVWQRRKKNAAAVAPVAV